MIRLLAAIGRSAQATIEHWNQVHGSLLAAAVSFYACFCVFPVILILLAGFGLFLQYTGLGQSYEQQLIRYLADQSSDELADQVHELLLQIEASAVVSGPLGLFFLLLTGLTLFVNFERCLGIIWGHRDQTTGLVAGAVVVVTHRLRGFLMLVVFALLILVNFLSYFAIDVLAKWLSEFGQGHTWWQALHLGSSLTLNTLLFTIIYRSLPRTRVPWAPALQGGCLAAFTWEIGRYVLALMIISDKYHAFGVVGIFMGLMMWAYYGAYVVLLGATLTRSRLVLAQQARQDRIRQRAGQPGTADGSAGASGLAGVIGADGENDLALDPSEWRAGLPLQRPRLYRRSIPLDDHRWGRPSSRAA